MRPLPPGGHHVLFVGNSLTYTNDLPRTLTDLATLGGDTIRTAAVALPDFALVDHAARALPPTVHVAGQHLDVPVETARLLQRAAHEANAAADAQGCR